MKEIGSAMKAETDKQYSYDQAVAVALLRSFGAAAVVLAGALSERRMPPAKFCRGAFNAVTVFLDIAAFLGAKRRPQELEFHVQGLVAGVAQDMRKDADPILSAWMFFDSFARALDGRPSTYAPKLGKLRAAALVGLRDVLAAAHDLLKASGGDADARLADRLDQLLDEEQLTFRNEELQCLRHHCPDRPNDEDE